MKKFIEPQLKNIIQFQRPKNLVKPVAVSTAVFLFFLGILLVLGLALNVALCISLAIGLLCLAMGFVKMDWEGKDRDLGMW